MGQILLGDCLQVMKAMPAQSVDPVFGSPPYEDTRTYGIGFNLKGREWVDWMVRLSPGGTVLDPFGDSGTTAAVA
jgi:DNA modification methylase